MFPTLQISLTGLISNLDYSIMVDLNCIDNKRYRYSFHQSKWIVAGPGLFFYEIIHIIIKNY